MLLINATVLNKSRMTYRIDVNLISLPVIKLYKSWREEMGCGIKSGNNI